MSDLLPQTPYETFRFIVWMIGLPIIVVLIVRLIRQVRAIRTLDAELREEERQNAGNPYYQMSRLYEAEKLLKKDDKKQEDSGSEGRLR
jgi:hypothetical protein